MKDRKPTTAFRLYGPGKPSVDWEAESRLDGLMEPLTLPSHPVAAGDWYGTAEAAEILGTTIADLASMRRRGKGPPWTSLGVGIGHSKLVQYPAAALYAWKASQS